MKYGIYAILIALLPTMLFLGTQAYKEAKAYEETTLSLIDEMSAEKLAKFQLKELAETVSLGFYKNKKKGFLAELKNTEDA